MVGPSTDDTSRLDLVRPALVVLVGVSSGLITLVGDATLLETALVVLAGLLLGVVLVRIVLPDRPNRRR